MEISEMIEVLQRAENRGIVERIHKYVDGGTWHIVDYHTWNFDTYNYRIKPEPKRVPLTKEDLIERRKLGFEAMWVKSKNAEKHNSEYFIDQISDEGCIIHNVYFSYEAMPEYFVWLDGTPCSKVIENE